MLQECYSFSAVSVQFLSSFLVVSELFKKKKKQKVIQCVLHIVSFAELLVVYVWREKTHMRNGRTVMFYVGVLGNKAFLAPGGSIHCSEVL